MPETDRLSNIQVVEKLKEALAAMEVKNYNWFKIRAYQNAIAVIENLTTSVQDMWEEGRLDAMPGIGEGLTAHLNDLFSKGVVADWEYLKKGLPDGMFELLGLHGIGAKKAFKLARAFKLENRTTAIEKLKIHAEKGDIQSLEGFGEKSEQDILATLTLQKMSKNDKPRMLLIKAEEIVDRVLTYMKKSPDVLKIDAAGSYRRRNATVGDLDLIVATNKPKEVMEYFIKFPEIMEISMQGERKTIAILTNGVQVDINVSKPEAYGAMLQYNTGSKQHNILLRTYALEKRMSLSEYGIKKKEVLTEYDNEQDFYKAVGLPYIPPELRSGNDEIALAKVSGLPKLVELSDIRGDLHTHTVFSDGAETLEEMVVVAAQLGYEYYGVSDHAPSVISRGYKEVERLILEQRKLVDEINSKQTKMKILLGSEINITAEAEMALPDELMDLFDYTIASIHTSFNQDKKAITNRMVKAIEHPLVSIIGHPTGRLISEREACDLDWKLVFDALVANNKIVEINSQPDRLDLTDDLVRMALEKNIKFVINTDAHASVQLRNMKYGIDVARRGYCTKQSIINTLPHEQFVKWLKKH